MGNFFTRIRERSFAVALTVAAVLTFGALAAAPATAVEADPTSEPAVVVETPVAPTLSGTIYGETVNGPIPLEGAYILTGRLSDRFTETDSSGHFTLPNMSAGPESFNVYYPPSLDELGFISADSGTFTIGSENVVRDMTLTPGSAISGTVSKNINGVVSPAVNLVVTGHPMSETGDSFAYTDTNGNYSLGSMAAGSYKVSFGTHGSGVGLVPTYYENASDLASATVIALPTAARRAGIDATLVSDGSLPPVTGIVPTITGEAQVGQTVTAASGAWVPSDTALTYAWTRLDGTVIGTDSTYAITEGDSANRLKVTVTGTAAAYESRSFTSAETTYVRPASTSTPEPTASPTATPTPTASPTTVPASELAVTGSPTPASVVGAKSDRVTTPAAILVVGASIPITGEGFKPFEVVDIWLHSTPVLLGTLTANARGSISGSFAMPTGLPTGTHHVVLVDEAGVSYTSAALVVTTTAALASTGADISSGWLALALMVLGGLALTVAARRRTASALK